MKIYSLRFAELRSPYFRHFHRETRLCIFVAESRRVIVQCWAHLTITSDIVHSRRSENFLSLFTCNAYARNIELYTKKVVLNFKSTCQNNPKSSFCKVTSFSVMCWTRYEVNNSVKKLKLMELKFNDWFSDIWEIRERIFPISHELAWRYIEQLRK